MINRQIKPYNFYKYENDNGYGEPVISSSLGTVKMAINLLTQNVSESAIYKDASYIGLTLDKTIKDDYLIQYGEEKLKVLYVNNMGRFSQVFLQKI